MKKIDVSLCASANRPLLQSGFKNWERFMNSLRGNKLNYEVIFVGDVECPYPMPENFKWIKATVKPAQAYEIAFRAAKGKTIHWCADDADYHNKSNKFTIDYPNSLDIAYACYLKMEKENNNDKKSVVAFRPIEDGGDVYKFHHFWGGWAHTPKMAPFALINRNYFVNKLGGYDRRFVSGQSENDVIMRVYEDGGRVEICLEAFLYVHHRQVHPRDGTGKERNKFRDWYNIDRQVLEDCWVPAGYGNYEKNNKNTEISKTRLSPVEKFDDKDITTITQSNKGIW